MARRFRTAGVCAGLPVLLVWLVETGLRGAEARFLDVLVIDAVGTPADMLADARFAASRLFGRLDVRVSWLDPPGARRRREALDSFDAQRAFMRSLYVVRLVAAGSEGRIVPSERAFGSAVAGTRIATIVFPRVEERAISHGVPVAVALGHVIAHELGHLLLERTTHSAGGLMQPTLNLTLAQQGLLLFSEEEGRTIRATLERDTARR